MTSNENINPDFRFGNFNIPDISSIEEISKSLSLLFNKNTGDKKQKTTFSISPAATSFIKNLSDECGVTQGSIVELAPLFFNYIALESMKRRKNNLSTLIVLANRITSTLDKIIEIAPHLKPFSDHLKAGISEITIMEKEAIETKNYKGVDPSGTEILANAPYDKEEPAFHQDIKRLLNNYSE